MLPAATALQTTTIFHKVMTVRFAGGAYNWVKLERQRGPVGATVNNEWRIPLASVNEDGTQALSFGCAVRICIKEVLPCIQNLGVGFVPIFRC